MVLIGILNKDTEVTRKIWEGCGASHVPDTRVPGWKRTQTDGKGLSLAIVLHKGVC